MSTFKPLVLWSGWAEGAEHRLVLESGRTVIEIEVKRTDALGEPCWQKAQESIKKHEEPVIFAALVGLGPKPDR